jgi:hypothetical protein
MCVTVGGNAQKERQRWEREMGGRDEERKKKKKKKEKE